MPHLTPPPLRSWPLMPVPWQHWFHMLWLRVGGASELTEDPSPGSDQGAALAALADLVTAGRLEQQFIDAGATGEQQKQVADLALLVASSGPPPFPPLRGEDLWGLEYAVPPQRTEQTADQELAQVLAYF